MTTTVYAARATMVSGTAINLLLFSTEQAAHDYVRDFSARLPLGFDRVDVVEHKVIGTIPTVRS